MLTLFYLLLLLHTGKVSHHSVVMLTQEGSLVLKCFQLLADALNQILTLEQVLVPNFHKQIEAMLKSMSESKVEAVTPTITILCCAAPMQHSGLAA